MMTGTLPRATRITRTMKYLFCFIVGILLSLPVAANVTDENAPIAQKAAYLATKDMYYCQNPEDYTSIVDGIVKDSPRAIIYDMQGRGIDHLQRGLNIIRMSDGKTKKVIVR